MRMVKQNTVSRGTVCFLTLLLGMTVSAAGDVAQRKLTLADQGRTSYVITLGDDAPAPERKAAEDLASYLGRVTGAKFAVKSPTEASAEQPCIMVGQTESVKEFVPDVDWKSLGQDGIVIKTKGQHLVLAGGRPRGTVYAVYTFLEDIVGCRWWTSTEEYIPHRPTLTIGRADLTYVPSLDYREPAFADVRNSPGFAVKIKCNGHFSKIPEELGGHHEILTYGHSFEQLMPPAKYFQEHPEWYSLLRGKRFAKGHSDWQLCLTNSQMLAELTKNVLDAIRRNPQAYSIFVTQNDGYGQCQCDQCQAATKREGTGAGPLLEMINAVAEQVDKEFPGFLVETFAYAWTRKTPLHVRPRSNVQIRVCGLEGDFAQPIDSDTNASYRDDIKGWSKIARNVVVFHYVSGYGCFVQPHPTLFNIGPDIRFFIQNKVHGVYMDTDSTPIGDFVRLRAWVFAHMLWNPTRDPLKLTEEFARGYYGLAGPQVLSYLQLAHNAVKRSGMKLHYANADTSFFSLDEMNEATRLWDQAEAAVAGDATLRVRVRRDRLPFDQAWLQNWARLKRTAERKGLEFLGPNDVTAACHDYVKTVTEAAGPDYVAKCVAAGSEKCIQRMGIEPGATSHRQLELYAEDTAPLPKELRGLAQNLYHIFQTDKKFLANKAELVDDLAATDGSAVRLASNWSMASFYVRSYFAGKWRVYARARCEMKELKEDGKGGREGTGYLSPQEAFEIGILDEFQYPNGRYVLLMEKALLAKVKDGAYHSYDLGVHDLNPGMRLWITIADSKYVSAVYVDRVFLIRDGPE